METRCAILRSRAPADPSGDSACVPSAPVSRRSPPRSRCRCAAANLTIGLGTDVTAIDPHYHNLTPNNNVAVAPVRLPGASATRSRRRSRASRPSGRRSTPTTWEFKLRKGVKFHDGSDFTAADVVASIERVPKVPNSPSPFTAYTKQITKIEVVDPHTIRFKTAQPYPLMPSDMSQVAIISKQFGERDAPTTSTRGKAAIGTGPYKLVRYTKGDRIELARNDAYWGGKTPWEKVTLRILTQDAARVAALLVGRRAGDRERADRRRRASSRATRSSRSTGRSRTALMYVHLDSDRDVTPFVTAKDGKPLDKNPLQGRARAQGAVEGDQPAGDRRARDGRRGDARPASSCPTSCSARRRTSRSRRSIRRARRSCSPRPAIPTASRSRCTRPTTATSTTRRSRRRSRRCGRAAASRPRSIAMPSATFFPQATDLKFSVLLAGWSTGTGESSSSLKALLMTFNKRQGLRHRQPRPLLQHQGRRADRGRAADRRRHQARGVPAARDRARDRRHRPHPAALPGQPVGDARRHRLRAARRRADAGVEVRAGEAGRGDRAEVACGWPTRSPSSRAQGPGSAKASRNASRPKARASSSTTSMRNGPAQRGRHRGGGGRRALARRRRLEATPTSSAWSRIALVAYGDLDVVVNNAGTTHRNQPMLDVTRRRVRPHLPRSTSRACT